VATSGLDPEAIQVVPHVIMGLAADGMTMIIATHVENFAASQIAWYSRTMARFSRLHYLGISSSAAS
jgi:ABC-type polar amino acid transport system ATPase subunit